MASSHGMQQSNLQGQMVFILVQVVLRLIFMSDVYIVKYILGCGSILWAHWLTFFVWLQFCYMLNYKNYVQAKIHFFIFTDYLPVLQFVFIFYCI